MHICCWKTGHEIADTVAKAIMIGSNVYCGKDVHGNDVIEAMPLASEKLEVKKPWLEWADIHIAYGILRGTDEVFRWCKSNNKPFACLDRGYWKPGHYDGYYRVSLNGTQQTFGLDKLEPDYARWDALGIDILPPSKRGLHPLVCPPTDYVQNFFSSIYKRHSWSERQSYTNIDLVGHYIYRPKDSKNPLQYDLDLCSKVITFNSSVGWEALRQGIPIFSDPDHSICGDYDKLMDKGWQLDYEARKKFFAIQASLQMTLAEMKQGSLWPLLQKLLSL